MKTTGFPSLIGMAQLCVAALTVLALSASSAALASAQQADTDDWPQWRGPERDDISPETGLMTEWPEQGPETVWQSNQAGLGYSGFSIVDDHLFTMGTDDSNEFVLCLDANTGDEKWRTNIDERYENNWGDGPRSTPTIVDGRAYCLSSLGTVACLDVADGSVVWTQSLQELGGKVPGWGYCESVLVDGDQVVCTPGGNQGAIAALDIQSGEVKWRSTLFTDDAHYASIIIADHPDKRHYVQLTDKSVVGINPEDGLVLWRQDWRGRIAVIPTPIYHDGMVYVTSGYGAGSMLVDITNLNDAKEAWYSPAMKNHHGGVILVDGHFYGHSDRMGWTCQDFETGEAVWQEEDALGKGAIGYADGHLYCVSEDDGEVVLIEATTSGWNEKGRFTLSPQSENRKPQGRVWVHPVIIDGRLFLRDQEMIWCFDVSKS